MASNRRRSYTEKILAARKRRSRILRTILAILAIALFQGLILQSFSVRATSMAPALAPGDRVFSFPLVAGALTPFGKLPALGRPRRGDIVILRAEAPPTESRWFLIWDELARFFTARRYSPLASRYGEEFLASSAYRVVGLPGDLIRRKGSIYEIMPKGENGYSTEFELSRTAYSITSPAANNAKADPVSNEPITVGQGEYFVVGDDRSAPDGSALWGPVGKDRIQGQVALVYWPLKRVRLP